MKLIKKMIRVFFVLIFLAVVTAFGINVYMVQSMKQYIISKNKAAELQDVDCVIILGCKVWSGGNMSGMLQDRMDTGMALMEADVSDKLIVSGDHGTEEYDEVNAMKDYAKSKGITSENVFMDHAGFSTYESMYRARDVFQAKKVIIVTQGYHLVRAVYDARKLGIDAYGVEADIHVYGGQRSRDIREVVARVKDFVYCIIKPKPKYLGEIIPISGSGDVTDD